MAFKYLMLYIDAHTFFLSPCVQYYSHFTVGNLLHPIDVQIDHVCPEVFNCIDLWPNKDVMWLIKSPIRFWYYTRRSTIYKKALFCKVTLFASKGWKQKVFFKNFYDLSYPYLHRSTKRFQKNCNHPVDCKFFHLLITVDWSLKPCIYPNTYMRSGLM